MKDEHHELHTPKNEHLTVSSNRKLKSINPSSKKPHHQQQKTAKPNAASSGYTPITVEDSIEKISLAEADQLIVVDAQVCDDTDSARGSSVSEAFVFYDDQASIESYIASFNQHISPSFITTPLSTKSPAATTPLSCITAETTPSSSTFTITTDPAIPEATIEELKSVKPDSLVKHLRESIIQVLNSSDIEPNHKNLLDALIKTVIEQFCTSHEDKKGSVAKRFSKKVKLVLLSYLLVMLLGSVGLFLLSDAQNSYHGPPPT